MTDMTQASRLPLFLNEIADRAVPQAGDPWPALRARLGERRNATDRLRMGRLQRFALVAAIVLAALVSLTTWGRPVASVSAAEVLQRAYEATSGSPVGPISSYHLRATRTMRPASGIFNDQSIEAWTSGPDRRRLTISCGDCPSAMTSDVIEADGQAWSISSVNDRQFVLRVSDALPAGDVLLPFGSAPSEMLRRAQQLACGTASLLGETSIAQRRAYIVGVNRQPGNSCNGLSNSGGPQRDTFWIDAESYLLLRAEQHLPQDRLGEQLATYQVDQVEYNVAVPDALFTYSPTAAATSLASATELKAAIARALQERR